MRSVRPPIATAAGFKALQFLQTSQKKFRLVGRGWKVHLSQTRCLSRQVSGTCAREEGLRTLTSPRREASLFKLGRNFGSGHFSFVRRSLQGSRQQVEKTPDEAAHQCPGYTNVLQIATYDELQPVGEAADIPLLDYAGNELRQSGTPGHELQQDRFDRAVDTIAHCRVIKQMAAE